MNEPEHERQADPQSEQRHWLYRPENWPRLWAAQIGLLVLVVAPDIFIHTHGHFSPAVFSLDMSPGFFAWYGFIACAAMVALAKVLGIFLKRDDRYYDD